MKRDICVLISLKRVLLNQNSEIITVASVIRTETQLNSTVWSRQKHSGYLTVTFRESDVKIKRMIKNCCRSSTAAGLAYPKINI